MMTPGDLGVREGAMPVELRHVLRHPGLHFPLGRRVAEIVR